MKWYSKLWLSPKAAKRKNALFQAIDSGKGAADVYVITPAQNPGNLLDIIPAKEKSLAGINENSSLYILGLACGKKEAFELVRCMVDRVYQETSGLDIRGYFSE